MCPKCIATSATAIAIMDVDGSLVEERRLNYASETETFAAFADELAGSRVVIEATGYYRPMYETLDEYLDVTLVNPSNTQAVTEAKVKNDQLDRFTVDRDLPEQCIERGFVILPKVTDLPEIRLLVGGWEVEDDVSFEQMSEFSRTDYPVIVAKFEDFQQHYWMVDLMTPSILPILGIERFQTTVVDRVVDEVRDESFETVILDPVVQRR